MLPNRERSRHSYGIAGAVAALAMLAAQLLWRVIANDDGVVQSFPELIATAISRLTPLSVFGEVTETYGSLAKRTLLVVVCLGVVAIGARTGGAVGRASAGASFPRRLLVSLTAGALLLLATLVVILPVANLGFFALESSYTADILTQLAATFALWSVAWTVLTMTAPARAPSSTGDVMPRRTVLRVGAAAVVAIVGTAGVAGSLRRMFRGPATIGRPLVPGTVPATGSGGLPVTATSQEAINDAIVATQRAWQRGEPGEETPVSAVEEPRDVAELQSDQVASPTADDPYAPFDQLEEAGELTPVLTTTDDFYHVSKNFSDPTVSADGWTLTIDGLVTTPLTLTHEQLVQRATTRKITTLCCISNELNGDLIGTCLLYTSPSPRDS